MIDLPDGFVYLEDVNNSIVQEVKYFENDNFVGQPIRGYLAAKCILTKQAATALSNAQQELLSKSLSLKVFDCYRPQRAVQHFIDWSKDPTQQQMKKSFYPNIDKKDFFTLGYVAEKSSHTRGSTVDLTIVYLKDKKPLNMGTEFDFMDELSHPLNKAIKGEAFENRMFLRELMINHGFEPLAMEWWHFTLKDEPFPETYFDFEVR